MFLPYNVDVPMERLPVANWILIAVTVIISCIILDIEQKRAQARNDIDSIEEVRDQLREHPDMSEEDKEKLWRQALKRESEYQAWTWSLQPDAFSPLQLISSQYVHGDLMHLFGNMLFLFVFGNAVNAKLGHGLFLLSYMLLGCLGGVAWLFLGNGRPAVGASGAIMGVMGIFVMLFPRNDVRIFYLNALGTGSIEFSSGYLIGFYIASDLFGSLFKGDGPVGYVCHLAAAVGGAATAFGLLWFRVIRPTAYEKNMLQVWDIEPPQRRKSEKRLRKIMAMLDEDEPEVIP